MELQFGWQYCFSWANSVCDFCMIDKNPTLNPVLVNNYRADVLESFHRGSFCVVDEKSQLIWSMGDAQQIAFPRSALKYFQHIPFILSGGFDALGFTEKDLAIMCASHNGESMHVEAVSRVLSKISLNAEALQCGVQQPAIKSDFTALIRNNQNPSVLHNNCSGKHAGFLAHCVYNKLDIGEYLSPKHILQQEIKKITALFYELDEKDLQVGIDGCSAPIFGMPLLNQALAYKNLVSPMRWKDKTLESVCNRIVKSVIQYPGLIGGSKRYCSDLVRITKGKVIGKTGADGIYCLAIPHKKWGISIKIDDGKMGPQYQVAHEILLRLGLLSKEEENALAHHWRFENINFAGNSVGFSSAVRLKCPF